MNEEEGYGTKHSISYQAWTKHSISYQHNRLWTGDEQFRFDSRVNNTADWETLSYTGDPDSLTPFRPYLAGLS